MDSPPLSETYALVDLYQSTNGDNWQWKQNYSKNGYPWNVTDWPNQNPCSVACTEKTSSERSITTLQLVAYGLRGKLQPSIGSLTLGIGIGIGIGIIVMCPQKGQLEAVQSEVPIPLPSLRLLASSQSGICDLTKWPALPTYIRFIYYLRAILRL